MVRVTFENVVQQSLGESLIFFESVAPSLDEDLSYCRGKADLRLYRFRVQCQCPLELLSGRLSGRNRGGPMPQGPSAHHEIPRVGIRLMLPLQAARCRYCELTIEGVREPPGNLVLRLIEVRATGVEAICPQVRAGVRIDQLHVHPDPLAG